MTEGVESVSLKRKYVELLENATGLVVELHDLKRQRRDWQHERAFLVDRNIDLELKLAKLEKEKAERVARRALKKDKRPRKEKVKAKNEDHEKSIDVDGGVAKEDFKKKRKPADEPPVNIVLNPKLCVQVVADRQCRLTPLPGFLYCHHHAAFDPNTGYIWCPHVDTNGRPCQISVIKSEYPYCKYHTKYHEPPPGWVPPIEKAKAEAEEAPPPEEEVPSKSWREPWKAKFPPFVPDEESSDEGEDEHIAPVHTMDDGDGEEEDEDEEDREEEREEGEEMDLGVGETGEQSHLDLGMGSQELQHVHHDSDVKDEMMVTLNMHQEPNGHDDILNGMTHTGWDMPPEWNL